MAATGERLTGRSALVVGAVSAVVFGCVAATAWIWVPLLLGPAYAPSAPVAAVVVAGLASAAVASTYASALHATDRAPFVAVAVWASAAASLVLVAVLGVRFGAIGAAWAVTAGYLLQCVLTASFHRFAPRGGPVPAS
jgi:O-antigen/teichoic acid export membrane protein